MEAAAENDDLSKQGEQLFKNVIVPVLCVWRPKPLLDVGVEMLF